MLLLRKTRKATGLNSLRLSSWEINEVTSKSHIDFLGKTCRSKTGKVNTTIEIRIFKLVLVPNFKLN